MAKDGVIALNSSRERPASATNGYVMLLVLLALIALPVWGFTRLARDEFVCGHVRFSAAAALYWGALLHA